MKAFKLTVYIYLSIITLLLIVFLFVVKDFFSNPENIVFFVPIGFVCSLIFVPHFKMVVDPNLPVVKRSIKKLANYMRIAALVVFTPMFIAVASSFTLNLGLHLVSAKQYESVSLTVQEKRIPYKHYGYYGHVVFKEFSSGTYEIPLKEDFLPIYNGQQVVAEGYSSKFGFELREIVFR